MKDAFVHDAPTVFVLDGDRVVREAVKSAARHLHLHAELYHSVEGFFDGCDPHRAGCLVADVHLQGLHGVEARGQLSERGFHLPVILLAARPEVAAAVRAIKAGAIHYLRKPCDDDELAEAIQEAIVWDGDNRRRLVFGAKVQRRLERLKPGERQVLDLLVDGRSNKAIAEALNVSIRAIETRRAKLMKKMHVQSLAELIRATLAVCGGFGESRAVVDRLG